MVMRRLDTVYMVSDNTGAELGSVLTSSNVGSGALSSVGCTGLEAV